MKSSVRRSRKDPGLLSEVHAEPPKPDLEIASTQEVYWLAPDWPTGSR
jgi:hypothetical protein